MRRESSGAGQLFESAGIPRTTRFRAPGFIFRAKSRNSWPARKSRGARGQHNVYSLRASVSISTSTFVPNSDEGSHCFPPGVQMLAHVYVGHMDITGH